MFIKFRKEFPKMNQPPTTEQSFTGMHTGQAAWLRLAPNIRMGMLASLAALGLWMIATGLDREMGLFWLFGLAFGFVLQRSRMCFASAFRDIFLLQHGRTLKGVLAGLAVATLGFGLVMSKQVPNPTLGFLPPEANVLPIGLHLVVGGLLFGIGMVIAGGCVSGSVYRMGEGYIASWVSFGGILVGLLLTAYTWNWWWDASIANGWRVWLPAHVGHGGAIALTLLVLLGVYLLVVWWESRSGIVIPETPFASSGDESFGGRIGGNLRQIFVHGWPAITGGIVLGGLNAMLFFAAHPWGFTGELSRWMLGLSSLIGIGPGELLGADSLPGCTLEVGKGGILHHMLFMVWGMVMGSFVGALFSGEFKIRRPRERRRYAQAAGGGLLMGAGATLAMGCTIGAFFSAIPSLALNGWVFAVCLAAGAWIGTQIIQHIE
jgi:uncharacterized protein